MVGAGAALAKFAVFGHGGGLNAAGCHKSRKTGGYLCHRSGYTQAPTSRQTAPSYLAQSASAGGYGADLAARDRRIARLERDLSNALALVRLAARAMSSDDSDMLTHGAAGVAGYLAGRAK